jgi:hypothetical protein
LIEKLFVRHINELAFYNFVGLILLSQVFKDNLTMERECVLTSFSLTPTEGLLNKLTQLAEKSGFVSMGIAQVRFINFVIQIGRGLP